MDIDDVVGDSLILLLKECGACRRYDRCHVRSHSLSWRALRPAGWLLISVGSRSHPRTHPLMHELASAYSVGPRDRCTRVHDLIIRRAAVL